MTAPTPPIERPPGPARAHFAAATAVPVPAALAAELAATGAAVLDGPDDRAEAGRDWWPLTLHWGLAGEVPALPGVVVRPTTPAQVAPILRACHAARVPVTPAGGRSGVCGASIPLHGGVALDLTGLAGVVDLDAVSGVVTVLPGTFGDDLEAAVRSEHGVTLGHWPQSMALSTVGGWLACRSAGQYSTRYGKIEDLVVGLDVVLADGTEVSTGGSPRAAVGPDLTQLFVGSEGLLGVITGARLRVRPVPTAERRAAYGFASFAAGLEACRRILRRGATPAVLRLYDEVESQRSYKLDATAALLVLDEGDPTLIDAVMAVVADECAGAQPLDAALVGQWVEHRNDTSALQFFTKQGFVVDTLEIAATWSALPAVYTATVAALQAVPTTIAASAHLSHSYPDGACLYFTFAATPPADQIEATSVALWDAGTRAVLAAGGNLSHHHGIGLNRARFVAEALGPAAGVLAALKQALDPAGILNPGKFGLASPWGPSPWP